MTTAEPWKRNWDQQIDAALRNSKLNWKTDIFPADYFSIFETSAGRGSTLTETPLRRAKADD